MSDSYLDAIKAKTKIKPGNIVMVSYPIGEQTNNPARKYNGQEFVVKDRRRIDTPKGGARYLFELHGAVSDMGVPYTFLADELMIL